MGEGVSFFYEYGRHMTAAQAGQIYEEKKRAALSFARNLASRIKKP